MGDREITSGRRSYLKGVGALATVGSSALSGCTLIGDVTGSETVTIASTVPRSGQFSDLGKEVEQGYQLGLDVMQDQLDRDVELVLKDDESDPTVVRQRLQQITSNNEVDMIWGSFSSLLVTAGSAFAENQDLPFLGAFFAFEEPHRTEGYEWTFAPFPKSRDMARSTRGLLELIPEGERPSRIGIWEPNTGWGNEQAEAWETQLDPAGFEIALRETYQIGNEDFSTLISQSQEADVEVLLSNPTPPGGITAINQMKANGWSPDVVQFIRAADPAAWWGALGENGAYVCMCPGWIPGLTGNGNEALWNAYESEYGLDDGEFIRTAVGGAYNIAQTALQAIQAADSTEPTAIQETLRSETFETVIGSFSFEDNGLPTAGELTAPIGQWWDGNQQTVFPDVDDERALDFRYPIPSWDEQ